MAQKLLLNVLVQVLGEFVEGLSEENLKLGVWSGKIVLQNLELNRASIQKLNLPVSVANGSVKRVEVIIPWTSLESQPVRIDMSGVFLQVGPVVVSNLDPADVSARALENKRHKIEALEKLALPDDEDKSSGGRTYLQRLTAKIIDNLEIRLHNLHIRYEDAQTIPGKVFSAGVTVDSFVVATTDEFWVESFVARAEGVSAAIHKQATMQNLAMYWNADSNVMVGQSSAQWQHNMEQLIFTAKNMISEPLDYLLAPPNKLIVKLTHNEHSADNSPKFDMSVDSTLINLHVDKKQYHQIMITKNQFALAERMQRLFLRRPFGRPSRSTAKEWWLYAVRRVLNRENFGSQAAWLNLQRCIQYRSRYIDLVVKSKRFIVNPKNPKESISVISSRETDEITEIEKLLPLEALTIYRQLAAVETRRERLQAAIDKPVVKPAVSSWFGWGKSGTTKSAAEIEEEITTMEKLKAELEIGLISSIPSTQMTWRFILRSSGVLNISAEGIPVANAIMAMTVESEMTGKGGITAKFSLDELQMKDLYTPTPLFPYLIKVPSASDSSAKLMISFASKDGVSNVRVDALPLELAWNKPCIQQILGIVIVPKLEAIIDTTDAILLAASLAPNKKKKNEEGEMNFIFEAEAPKIILPDDCSSNSGFLILDSGTLSVRGLMKGEEGMSWKVTMASINAHMTSTLGTSKSPKIVDSIILNLARDGVSSYLIKPFDVSVDVQTFDSSRANMTVDLNISPGIKADLDAVKLARVLDFSKLVVSTFGNDNEPVEKAKSILTRRTESATQGFIPTEISGSHITGSPQKSSDDDRSALDFKMIVTLVVPLVSLDLHYDTVNSNHLVVAATDLYTLVKSRAYDFQASFTMNSLLIEDSSRSASQRELAWTRADNQDENLVSISYISINHRRSPLFRGYGSEIFVAFGSLFMNSDTKTLMHLRPFYEVLLGKRFRAAVNTGVPNMSAKTNLPLRRTSRSQTLQRTVSDAPAVSTKPVGTHILLTLGKIRLEFLKPKAIDNPYILKTRSASPDVFYDRKRSDSRGSITHDSMSPAEDLDSVFALEVSGLFTEVKNMDLIECTVSIHSFEILDTRAISEDYEFRTLFRPDFNLADNLKPSTPCSDAAEITGNSLSSPVANLRSGFPNLSTPKANRGDNLLELTYRQHSKQYSVVDISVGSVTSFFSLDVILELINITVANSLAVVALVATVDTVVSPEVITLPAMQKTVAQINLNSNGEPNSNVMTVCVNAPNMRLILLEDPTIRDTRAVVGRCGVEVKYSREVSMGLMQEVNESLHISVLNAEIFVMTTMMRWNPLQILEPVGMELHYKRSQEKGVVLSTSVALDVDAIDARVSLNDLILARAIASRGLTNSTGDAHVQQNFSSNAAISTTIPPTQITTYNVHISLGEVSLVVVNDFNGQNLPILKLSLNGTTFTADGALQSLNGSGSLILALDYFNPRVFMWEPILEPWFPYLELKTGSDGTKINISQADSECFQISVTGTMLESLMRTYSLLLQADDTNDRTVASAATFQNLLGVPIEIYDGDTKLFDLIDGSTKNLSRLQTAERGHGSGHVRTTAQLTKCFSVAFLDKMKQDRQPILNLPVNISKPQSYQVLPLRPVASESRSPVVEDIYEMERYQPLSGSWKAPFMMNDPPQWATIDYKPRDISDISLPPGGGWEWQGQWTVEVAAQPKRGENFDPETDLAGWEYAANFSAFSSSNKRRGKPQTFDYVRRRRWVRTRVPEFSEDNDGTRPLTLFWDVQLLPTGCRRVLIRSGFQIRNALSFPVLVKLANSVYKSDFELGPIEPDAIFFVPILYASSSSLCVKPSGSNCQWSQLLQCSHSTMDYERSFNIYCSQSPTQSIYFKAIISKVEKSTVVILSPLFNLENRLPCILKYRVVTELSQQSDKLPVPVEEGCLEAGESCLLYHISDAERARISISAGHLGWSQYIYLVGGRKNVVPLGLPTQLGPIGLHVLLRVETGMDSTEQITICSQGALVDRSNLGICVRSVFSDGRELVRISSANNANDTGPASTSIRCVTTDPIAEDIVRLLNFSCKSHRNYIVSVGRHGDFVYVDNNFAWTYLPDFFYGHTSIRTCSSDRKIRFKELMEFEVDRKSIVFVLHDSHEESPPKWISSGGFHKIIEQAIARHVVNNVVIEHHYSIYGIFVDPGVKVILGQNLSMSASSDMYSVFVLPDIFDKLRDQLLFEKSIQSDDASNSWVDGMNGLTLFNYSNETVSFGVRGGEFWSPLMHMKKISSGKGPFEIIDRKTNRSYQLCYSVQSMPGKFHRTNLTTVMPRYCIVNCMEEPIEVRQIGTRRTTYVPSYHTEGWHKAEADKGTQIQIKTNSTVWSLGAVDINEIGSTVFLLPLVDGSNTINADSAEVEIDPVVVHVEVKLAESHENCAVTVIIWREEIGQATAYSVRNDSSQPVVLQQSNVNFSGMRPELISKFELCVPPGKRIPFGWTDPDASSAVTIAIGKNLLSAGRRAAEISFLESGKALRIAGVLGNKEVIMCVTPEGSGKVLHIVDRAEDLKLVPHLSTLSKTPLEHITACLTFRRFGISLVLDRPVRRELFSFYMKKVMTKFSLNEGVNSTEVTVDDFQVDNYSETAVYPVMLYCVKPNPREVEDGDTSAIKFCVVRVNSGASTQHYRYLALRVLPIAMEIDSATLELVADDLLKFLTVVSRDEALATFCPQKWIQEFNMKLLSLEQRKKLVDVYRSQISAQGQKMFLENFILHPMKIQLSFQKTRFPRNRQTNATDFITAFASVDRMDIKLSSFIVVNAMESAATLKTRIVAKLGQDLQSQIASIAGSLSIIGSPAGFARNVGNGVQAFFYEPAQGLVQGPQDFVIGIGKGTTSLVTGVVSGALNSTAGVIRNVSSGLSLLSGDAAYIEDRNKSRQQSTRGGIVSGIVGGGESVMSGFASGVSGLFTKPIEGAQKDGALGFVRGVGMGVFGAAVKPVIGVTDGITHMAQGISNELSDTIERKHFRPPRAFIRSEADPTELVLSKFSITAAFGQAFVKSKASKLKIGDSFVCVIILDKIDESRVILSEKFLYWNMSRERLWCKPWTSISHCTFMPPQTIGVVLYEASGRHEAVPIECKNVSVATELYKSLVQNAFRMGNPGAVASLNSVFGTKRAGAYANPGSLFEYNFGSVNMSAPISIPAEAILDSNEVIHRAKERLKILGGNDWPGLDLICYSMVHEWSEGHSGLRAARCCLLLLINKSAETIQINRTQLVEGKSFYVLPGFGFDEESRTIAIGGFALFFGTATASAIEYGNLSFRLSASAAEILVSSVLESSYCENLHGTHGGFLEKSVSNWWCKYVVCITR